MPEYKVRADTHFHPNLFEYQLMCGDKRTLKKARKMAKGFARRELDAMRKADVESFAFVGDFRRDKQDLPKFTLGREPKNSLKWNAHQLKRNNGDMTVVSQRYSGADMVAVNALNLEPSSTHSTRSPTGRCYLDIASTLLGGVPLPGRGSPHAPQPLQHASEPTISSVELRANSPDETRVANDGALYTRAQFERYYKDRVDLHWQ